MRIGQLAQLVGVETQTIRFYEQQGLLPPPDRQDNGYRVYTEKHGEGLAFIRRCRILGLSLAEIHELQSYQDDPHQPCTAVNALLDDHISHVQLDLLLVPHGPSCTKILRTDTHRSISGRRGYNTGYTDIQSARVPMA